MILRLHCGDVCCLLYRDHLVMANAHLSLLGIPLERPICEALRALMSGPWSAPGAFTEICTSNSRTSPSLNIGLPHDLVVLFLGLDGRIGSDDPGETHRWNDGQVTELRKKVNHLLLAHPIHQQLDLTGDRLHLERHVLKRKGLNLGETSECSPYMSSWDSCICLLGRFHLHIQTTRPRHRRLTLGQGGGTDGGSRRSRSPTSSLWGDLSANGSCTQLKVGHRLLHWLQWRLKVHLRFNQGDMFPLHEVRCGILSVRHHVRNHFPILGVKANGRDVILLHHRFHVLERIQGSHPSCRDRGHYALSLLRDKGIHIDRWCRHSDHERRRKRAKDFSLVSLGRESSLSQNGRAILAVNVCTHNPCKCKHSKF